MSLWQIAQAAVRIRTSPGPGSASSTVSIGQGRAEGAADGGFRFHGNNPAEWRDLGGCGSIPRLGQEFKRSLVARGNNFCGAGRGGWVSWAAARAFGRGPIFSRRWMRFCVTRRGARAPLVSHQGQGYKVAPWATPSGSRRRAVLYRASRARRGGGRRAGGLVTATLGIGVTVRGRTTAVARRAA